MTARLIANPPGLKRDATDALLAFAFQAAFSGHRHTAAQRAREIPARATVTLEPLAHAPFWRWPYRADFAAARQARHGAGRPTPSNECDVPSTHRTLSPSTTLHRFVRRFGAACEPPRLIHAHALREPVMPPRRAANGLGRKPLAPERDRRAGQRQRAGASKFPWRCM